MRKGNINYFPLWPVLLRLLQHNSYICGVYAGLSPAAAEAADGAARMPPGVSSAAASFQRR
jgi:hypothetical protein